MKYKIIRLLVLNQSIINGAKSATGSSDDAATLAKKTEIGVFFAYSDVGSMTDDESFMDWATNIITFAASDDFDIEEAENYIAELLSEESSDGSSEVTGECGAYIAPGVWKEFDCYNLAAIGKTTGDDPFTPSWRLIGGYWQWGRKGPDESQWYDTNTANFAHGPTGPDEADANHDSIDGWDTSYNNDGIWSDSEKSVNDPCPSGYRIPTESQWCGVIDNNTQSIVGSWLFGFPEDNVTNYSSAIFFGNDLMLPATGYRLHHDNASLNFRGHDGYYWSSTSDFGHYYGGPLDFTNYDIMVGGIMSDRRNGFSVRCIAE